MNVSNMKPVMAKFSRPLICPEDSFLFHVRFKPTKMWNRALNVVSPVLRAQQVHEGSLSTSTLALH